jgi:hypothetical protein
MHKSKVRVPLGQGQLLSGFVTISHFSALWVTILDEQCGNEEGDAEGSALSVLLQEAQQ